MMKQFQLNSYLFGGNAPYVEEMYEAYLDNPGVRARHLACLFRRVAERAGLRWHATTTTWPMARSSNRLPSAPRPMPSFRAKAAGDLATARKQVYVQSLIAAYRFLGSRWANLDPLKRPSARISPSSNPRSTTSPKPTWTRRSMPRTLLRLRTGVAARDRQGAARNILRHASAPSSCTSAIRSRSAGGRKSSSRSARRRTSRPKRRSTSWIA